MTTPREWSHEKDERTGLLIAVRFPQGSRFEVPMKNSTCFVMIATTQRNLCSVFGWISYSDKDKDVVRKSFNFFLDGEWSGNCRYFNVTGEQISYIYIVGEEEVLGRYVGDSIPYNFPPGTPGPTLTRRSTRHTVAPVLVW